MIWPISPNVAIEIRSLADSFAATVAKIELFIARGSIYAVAIDPTTREVVELDAPA
jgi:hypothetical protein